MTFFFINLFPLGGGVLGKCMLNPEVLNSTSGGRAGSENDTLLPMTMTG